MKIREILARNLAALMKQHPEMGSTRMLADRCTRCSGEKIGHNTIGRMLDANSPVSPKLDTIVSIANAFRVQPWMLLAQDFNAQNKTGGTPPPPEILALAYRIMENRAALMDVLAPDAIPDKEMESLGWMAGAAPAAHQDKPGYVKPPRQLTMKLKG